jgi:hypothetical protein
MNENKWIKESLKDLKIENSAGHHEIIDKITKLGEAVSTNQNRITTLERDHQSHLSIHKKIEGMSRTQATVLIAVIQIIAMVVIAFLR